MKRLTHLILFFGCATLTALAQSPGRPSYSDISNLLKKAKEGNTSSQVKLGMAFLNGSGIAVDLNNAEYWLKTAAGFGDLEAQTRLGLLYLRPEFRNEHGKDAQQWFLRAAASDYKFAEHNLGLMNLYGWGIPINQAEAVCWFRKAARRGLIQSKVQLSIILARSNSESERMEGLAYVREAAKARDPLAMAVYGYYHQLGIGVKPDVNEAAKWYQRSADAGDGQGMHNLAALYKSGTGVRKDIARSIQLSKGACEAGVQRSCVVVALAYLLGDGVQRDMTQAYRYGLRGDLNNRFVGFDGSGLPEDVKQQASLDAEHWKRDHLVIEWMPQ